MLMQLTINNFAIVRHLVLELNEGMSVITGETGQENQLVLMHSGYVWVIVLKAA